MKITNIEVIPIAMPLAKRYDNPAGLLRMYDLDQHVVVKVHTDNGLVGYGDYEDIPQLEPDEWEPLLGRNPFDFINNNFNMALGMALYDLMGKHLGIPAYKLMGQKVRSAVRVAAWTRPCPPDIFRAEVKRAAEQGYRVFKMHSDARYDLIEQTKAAESVAPPGFKLHWDFNHNRTLGTVLPIITELERNHPIVGYIEDPLPWADIDGWRTLRRKTRLPLIMHVPQLGGLPEVMHGCADIYMAGGQIGKTLLTGFAYGQANVPVLLQQSGNALMRALTLHQAAVLPTATAHIVVLDDQYEQDFVTTQLPVAEGFSFVPEGPGLGVEIDEDKLAEFAQAKPIPEYEFIGVLTLPGGRRMFSLGEPDVEAMTGHEEGAIPGISYERRQPDGSDDYERIKARLQAEGPFMAD